MIKIDKIYRHKIYGYKLKVLGFDKDGKAKCTPIEKIKVMNSILRISISNLKEI